MMVDGKVDRTEGPPANLLLDHVLVDAMYGGVPQGTVVGWRRAEVYYQQGGLTCLAEAKGHYRCVTLGGR